MGGAKTEPVKALGLDDPRQLLAACLASGRRVIAPRETDGAMRYVEVTEPELPRGRSDAQAPGSYRLEDGDPDRWFDYVVGPFGLKEWLFPARQKLWSAKRDGDGFTVEAADPVWPETVFFGVRPCDLAAIERQDAVFGHGPFADPGYLHRRSRTLIVTVQCARSAPTCFCTSMGTGPRAEAGFDLALTELGAGADPAFLLEVGTDAGAEIAATLGLAPASAETLAAAARASDAAAAAQTRTMPPAARHLADHPEAPAWDAVAERCLACGNCTLACPTCFCTDVEDTSDLLSDHAERWRLWDSCFTSDFTFMGGGPVRRSTASRYRQWMTHKLSTWHDQFGTSGCVGCGRCVAWCPVGIDITAEAAAVLAEAED